MQQLVMSQATYSTQYTQLASRLYSITTITTGQKTIGSDTQSALLVMGVKTPETC
jgi:type I site-specific restriction endonuclease